MPDKESPKFVPTPDFNRRTRVKNLASVPDYAELQVTSNFSFLSGASHPEELVATASEFGMRGISITDLNSLAGVVRAHGAAKSYPIQYIVGSKVEITCQDTVFSLLVYPVSRKGYGNLCRLLTLGKLRVEKDKTYLTIDDFLAYQPDLMTVIVPPYQGHDYEIKPHDDFSKHCTSIKDNSSAGNLVSLCIQQTYANDSQARLLQTVQLSKQLELPLVVTNDVYAHSPKRQALQEVLTCIKNKTSLDKAGHLLFQNGQRHLKSPHEMWRLFRDFPAALKRTVEIAQACTYFSLDELRYEYPLEIYPKQHTPQSYLRDLVEEGIVERYPMGIDPKIRKIVEEELVLINELEYEKYFLTCYDIVKFARSKEILCQGRGAAANSVVCYCLGVTSVDPTQIELLFARFVCKERIEPPDIDIDFEHERREEVIQYIYSKYGREYAGLTAGVVTYRHRSAIREVGKVLGLSLEIVDLLAKKLHHWTDCQITDEDFKELGLNKFDPIIQNTLRLTNELYGFPRHLSQHVGGFIICRQPLCETVPILNARMEGRTIIEWDKDDIEVLGILKIDILALGMLTCVRKALDLINARRTVEGQNKVEVYTIPHDDQKTYEMIRKADTLGVFQIESRAQMSMLPRLKPKIFYDLVIQVAIVRPGPIQGNMVHPYLKRRDGLEIPHYPDERARAVLGKTLGVPLFQEQAMRLAIVLADFTPGEAEQLRKAMAAWKRNEGVIAAFKERIIKGMTGNGYSIQFAETCMTQLKGFAEYGFPESHAASFALIAYASSWIKCHYPAEFMCALLNSQPMGFYQPAQIISDGQAHGVSVLPVDVNQSQYDCRLENSMTMRLGMRCIKGMNETQSALLTSERTTRGNFTSMKDIWDRTREQGLRKQTLEALANADAFNSLDKSSRQSHWDIQTLQHDPTPIEKLCPRVESQMALPLQELPEKMFQDYNYTGFSLKAHPLSFARTALNLRRVFTTAELRSMQPAGKKIEVSVAGLAIIRQRPGTANGVVFITIEDETGIVNLMIRPRVFDKYQRIVISSTAILARGKLDKVGEIAYITTDSVESLDELVMEGSNVDLPGKSYSY